MDKPIDWCGSALDDLRAFPGTARQQAGHQLRRLQRGEAPTDWRPFPQIGRGGCEIRIDCADGWFRIMYVAIFDEAIYVLHSFQKASRKTRKRDVEIAQARYRRVARERDGKE